MAARTISARLCRYCARTEAQNRQRRNASSVAFDSSGAAETSQQPEVQIHHQDSLDSQHAGSPVASTSKAKAHSLSNTKLAASLRFEVSQARPVPSLVWKQFRQLFEDGSVPASPSEKDLIDRTTPILMQYARPARRATGQGKVIAVRESGEALYGRYRFVCNRLKEAGQLDQTPEQLLGWLKGIERLGYGPAAWKIWEDHLEAVARLGQPPSIPVAHAALITTMRWLVMMKRDEGSRNLMLRNVPESLEHAYAIAHTLEKNGLYDWITRSLLIRTVKESGLNKELERLLKKEFAFDPAFPSLLTLDESTGQMVSAPERMDVHTLNTMLSRYSNQGDLSKMMSLFETATCTARRAQKLRQLADQNSFFSTSMYPPEEKSVTPYFTQTATGPSSLAKEATDERISPEAEVYAPTPHPISLQNVNTQSFELLVSTALRLGRIRIAYHYLQQLFQAWQYEQERLKAAYIDYVNKAEKASQGSLQEIEAFLMEQDIIHSRVSLSVHAVWLMHEKFKFSRSQKQKYGAVVLSTLDLAKEALEALRGDAGFWDAICEAQASLEMRLPVKTAEELAAGQSMMEKNYPLNMQPRTFNIKEHRLLQSRLEYELADLTRYIEVASMDMRAGREAGPLLYALSERRWLQGAANEAMEQRRQEATELELETHESLSERRIRLAIDAAGRWLDKDAARDEGRLELLRSTLRSKANMSALHIEAKLRAAQQKHLRRRELVAEAMEKAKALQSEAMAEKRIAREKTILAAQEEKEREGTDQQDSAIHVSYSFSGGTMGSGKIRKGGEEGDGREVGGNSAIRLLHSHSESLSGKLSLA